MYTWLEIVYENKTYRIKTNFDYDMKLLQEYLQKYKLLQVDMQDFETRLIQHIGVVVAYRDYGIKQLEALPRYDFITKGIFYNDLFFI